MGKAGHREYFPLLDGVRGMAAIAVMFRHMSLFGIHAVAQSYLGVDVFFALSGAVIASAYELKLRAGMSAGDFLRRRVIRLWPMIALGVALGLINAIWGQPEAPMGRWVWILAAVALVTAGDNPLLPMVSFNRPSWTMAFEFAVNIVYAKLVHRLTGRVLIAICGICAVILAWAAFAERGLDVGGSYNTLLFGAGRTGFAFFLGVGLYRLYRTGRLPVPLILRKTWGVVACGVLLALCLFAPPLHGLRWIIALLSVLMLVPAIVALGLASEVGGRLSKVCLALGALSYPLYLIHDPLGMLVASNLIRFGHSNLLPIAAAVFAPATVLLALVVHYWVDEPVRAWLGKAFANRRSAGAVVPAE